MRKFVSVLICILFLTGCAAPAPETVVSVRETPEAQEVFLTAEPQTTAPTEAPTEAPTPEPTPEPTEEPTPEPTPEPTATPVPFVALAIPQDMRVRNGFTASQTEGLVRRDADGAFFRYGSAGGTEPCFFPCDETGAVAPGEEPTDTVCIVPAYTPTDKPKKDGARQLVVYLASQSVVGYIAEDGDWVQERVMICSSGRQKHETPTGHFKIYQRYEYKVLGTGDTHCYGFYACRFKGHYLFHSVPISYDAGRIQKKGHRMCDMHKFEKLGTPASDGCVRLTVADAKWVYEISEHDTVTVWVTKDAGPSAVRPPEVIWEEPYTDKNGLGWDPTDPNEDNPYLSGNA